jgi:hypothetical protein
MNDDENEANNSDSVAPEAEAEEIHEHVPRAWKKFGPSNRWKPGQSGNPKGRPVQPKNVQEVKQLARSYTVQAIKTLASIAGNPKAQVSSRVAASEALLARGWGRAPATDLEGAEGMVIQIMKFASPQIEDGDMKVIEGVVTGDEENNTSE